MKILLRYFLLTILACLPAFGQFDKATVGSEPIKLIYADSLLGSTSEAGMVREVIGHVRFEQGNVTITCDRANQYMDQNRVEFLGNVILTQGTVTLRTPFGEYNGNTKIAYGNSGITLLDREMTLKAIRGYYSTASHIANFYDHVVVDNDSLIIYSDTLQYERDSQDSYSTGRVFAAAKYSNAILRGDSLTNIPSQHYTRVVGSPMLCQIDSSASADTSKNKSETDSVRTRTVAVDTLCIAADILEAFRNDSTEKYVATGKVRVTRGKLSARSDTAVYEKTHDLIHLIHEPVVWLDSTQLTSDSIVVTLHNNRLQQIAAYRNAFMVTHSDTVHTNRFNQLTGERIFIMVDNDTLRLITAEQKAFSLYFLYSDSTADGVSRNSADTIRIALASGEVERIHWLGSVDGEFIPEHLVYDHVSDYQLRNFKWLTNRPKLSLFINPHLAPLERPTPGQKKKQAGPKK